MSPKTPAQLALEQLLPPKNGRMPADRLRAIAGKALADARRTVPELTTEQAEDAFAQMLEAGTDAALRYDPAKDKGAPNTPLDIRFGAFAYYRMRQRFTDWYRKNIHDSRPGRSDRRTVSLESLTVTEQAHTHDPYEATDDRTDDEAERSYQHWAHAASVLSTPMHEWDHVTEVHAMRWARAAQTVDLSLDAWIRRTLDIAANHQLSNKQAA